MEFGNYTNAGGHVDGLDPGSGPSSPDLPTQAANLASELMKDPTVQATMAIAVSQLASSAINAASSAATWLYDTAMGTAKLDGQNREVKDQVFKKFDAEVAQQAHQEKANARHDVGHSSAGQQNLGLNRGNLATIFENRERRTVAQCRAELDVLIESDGLDPRYRARISLLRTKLDSGENITELVQGYNQIMASPGLDVFRIGNVCLTFDQDTGGVTATTPENSPITFSTLGELFGARTTPTPDGQVGGQAGSGLQPTPTPAPATPDGQVGAQSGSGGGQADSTPAPAGSTPAPAGSTPAGSTSAGTTRAADSTQAGPTPAPATPRAVTSPRSGPTPAPATPAGQGGGQAGLQPGSAPAPAAPENLDPGLQPGSAPAPEGSGGGQAGPNPAGSGAGPANRDGENNQAGGDWLAPLLGTAGTVFVGLLALWGARMLCSKKSEEDGDQDGANANAVANPAYGPGDGHVLVQDSSTDGPIAEGSDFRFVTTNQAGSRYVVPLAADGNVAAAGSGLTPAKLGVSFDGSLRVNSTRRTNPAFQNTMRSGSGNVIDDDGGVDDGKIAVADGAVIDPTTGEGIYAVPTVTSGALQAAMAVPDLKGRIYENGPFLELRTRIQADIQATESGGPSTFSEMYNAMKKLPGTTDYVAGSYLTKGRYKLGQTNAINGIPVDGYTNNNGNNVLNGTLYNLKDIKLGENGKVDRHEPVIQTECPGASENEQAGFFGSLFQLADQTGKQKVEITTAMDVDEIKGNRTKGDRWWPEGVGETLQAIGYIIECKSEETITVPIPEGDYGTAPTYTKRTFTLTNADGTELEIIQNELKEWKDHDVTPSPVVDYINEKRDRDAAYVSHCSAGVGRSGVMIVMEILHQCTIGGQSLIDKFKDNASKFSDPDKILDSYAKDLVFLIDELRKQRCPLIVQEYTQFMMLLKILANHHCMGTAE